MKGAKQITLLIFVLINFAFTACKKDPALPPIKFQDSLGTLSVGQTGLFYLKDTTLELKFVKVVSDSRCPEGAQCIWAGDISAEILMDKSLVLVPSLMTSVYYKGNKIVIISATPYPESGKTINPKDYKVEFKISK